MSIRPTLVVTSIAGAIATYFAGRMQAIDDRWPTLAAAIAVGAMLVVFLHLFAGGDRTAHYR